MAASTQTLRYPGPMYNDLLNLIALLISSSRSHFLLTSYTSFTGDQIDQAFPHPQLDPVLNVMRRLLQPTNRMVSMTPSKTACYISTLNIIQGDVDPTDVHSFFHITSAFHTLHTLSSPSAVLLCPLVCLSFQPAPALNSTPKSTNPSFASALYVLSETRAVNA
ncbi:hypothetical protein JB92DRAFT_3136773 [Gautieria morchelliformis]|nr:hypothetical protein JB92DRAFT_3136773 [Gautieria morchelliformis]